MNASALVSKAMKAGAEMYFAKDGALYSMNPPETMFGFTYHAQMIPPMKPEHTLILGYGGGTVAALMRKIWGDCKITGVDQEKYDSKFIEYKMKIMDAKKFLWDATTPAFKDYVFAKEKYDYICVDLWNGKQVPEFIFYAEFAVRLMEISKGMVALNIHADDFKKLRAFKDYGFEFERHVQIENQLVVWWSRIND